METQVTTYYLELRSVDELVPSTSDVPNLEIREARIASPELGRFLYTAVGRAWGWTDRLSWSHSRWLAHLERPEVEVWIAHLDGVIAGYAELERQPEESVEIAYFGLLSQFMGKGIGGFLLSDTVQRAFRAGARGATGLATHLLARQPPGDQELPGSGLQALQGGNRPQEHPVHSARGGWMVGRRH